jgi:hypothetical protein
MTESALVVDGGYTSRQPSFWALQLISAIVFRATTPPDHST